MATSKKTSKKAAKKTAKRTAKPAAKKKSAPAAKKKSAPPKPAAKKATKSAPRTTAKKSSTGAARQGLDPVLEMGKDWIKVVQESHPEQALQRIQKSLKQHRWCHSSECSPNFFFFWCARILTHHNKPIHLVP